MLHATSGKLTDSKNANAVDKAAADVAKLPCRLRRQPADAAGRGGAEQGPDDRLPVGHAVSQPRVAVGRRRQKIIDARKSPPRRRASRSRPAASSAQKVSKPATESSELIGIIAAMVILTFTFGTVVAMLLPIVTAIFALLTTLAIIRMLGHVATVPTVAPTLATMIGLGVGIDYALFIVTRHFRGMNDGLPIDESIARAAATSGGAVFFAGGTVTIALVSLAVAGIPLVTTMGLMAAIAVVVAVIGALTLLPAVLAILGPQINSLRVRHPIPRSRRSRGCGRSGRTRSPSSRWSRGSPRWRS